MGELINLVQDLRSCEDFLPRPISWEQVTRILDAGRLSLSTGNLQNWKFILIIDNDQKYDVAKACFEHYEISLASAHIVVCGEPEKAERYYGSRGKKLYTVQNCSMALNSMVLQAQELGLASRWVAAFDEEELCSLLNIPSNIRPQAVLAIGYNRRVQARPPTYPITAVTYFGHYGSTIKDYDKFIQNYGAIMKRNLGALATSVKEHVRNLEDYAQPYIEKVKEKVKQLPDSGSKE